MRAGQYCFLIFGRRGAGERWSSLFHISPARDTFLRWDWGSVASEGELNALTTFFIVLLGIVYRSRRFMGRISYAPGDFVRFVFSTSYRPSVIVFFRPRIPSGPRQWRFTNTTRPIVCPRPVTVDRGQYSLHSSITFYYHCSGQRADPDIAEPWRF